MTDIRVAEVLAALSLTTDLASGLPFEKGLRVCLVADALAERLDLEPASRTALFQATLLRSIGCTAHAPENAAEFVDDVAFQHTLKLLDPGDAEVFGAQLARFGDWTGTPGLLAARFLELAPTVGPHAASTGCEISRALAPGLQATARAVAALDDVYERWDGLGIPAARRGTEISSEGRILHLAEQIVLAHAAGGPAAACAEAARRSGGHLDPELVALFLADPAPILADLGTADALEEVLDREPAPWLRVGPGDLPALCAVLGQVADLKSVHLIGHSARLARVVATAAIGAGLSATETAALTSAAHLHNLGCVVVPSSTLDRPGAPGAADRERLRLQGYWTRRILERCPGLTHLEPLTRAPGALHAAFAEGGYDGWQRPGDLAPVATLELGARILEAAEAWTSLTESRPGRPALDRAAAVQVLDRAVAERRLDSDAVALVLADGGTAPRAPRAGLSQRELEVLRLAARGMSNKEIAASLVISERTVGHHLAHIYDKTGNRTRAGVAVWAAHRGLLPAEPE